MPQALIVNRRLMVGIYPDDSRKAVDASTTGAPGCKCCDGVPETCTGPCQLIAFYGEFSDPVPNQPFYPPDPCCLPNSFSIRVTGTEPQGPFMNLNSGSSKYTWQTFGVLDAVACLSFRGFFEGGNGPNWVYGANGVSVGGLSISITDAQNGAGEPQFDLEIVIKRVSIALVISAVLTTTGPRFQAFVQVVACEQTTTSNDTITTGPGSFLLFETKYDGGPYPTADSCGADITGDGRPHSDFLYHWSDNLGGVHDAYAIHWAGGTFTVRWCCDPKPDPACGSGFTLRWFKQIRCSDDAPTEFYAPPGRSYETDGTVYFDFTLSTCFYLDPDQYTDYPLGTGPDRQFWIERTVELGKDQCDVCTGGWLTVNDCAGGLLGYVLADGFPSADKVRRLTDGPCVNFGGIVYDEDLPDDATTFEAGDFSGAFDDCAHCTPAADCPADISVCPSTFTGTFTPSSDCASLTDITPKAGTLTANLLTNKWRYSQYPDTQGDEGSGIDLFCDGEYYYAVVSDLIEGGDGYSMTFRKLRSGACPPTGDYEFVSSSIDSGICDSTGSTFSLA